jgi:hypothetical protein
VADASILTVAVVMDGAVQASAAQLQERDWSVTAMVLSVPEFELQEVRVVVTLKVMVVSDEM